MTPGSGQQRTSDPNIRYYQVRSDGSVPAGPKGVGAPAGSAGHSRSFWALMIVIGLIVVMVIVLVLMALLEGGTAESASMGPTPLALFAALISG